MPTPDGDFSGPTPGPTPSPNDSVIFHSDLSEASGPAAPPPLDADAIISEALEEELPTNDKHTLVEAPEVKHSPTLDATTPDLTVAAAKRGLAKVCNSVRSANKIRVDGHTTLATLRSLIEAIDKYPFQAEDESQIEIKRAMSCFRNPGVAQHLVPIVNIENLGKSVKYIVAARINHTQEEVTPKGETKAKKIVGQSTRNEIGNVALAFEQALQSLPWAPNDILIVPLPDKLFSLAKEYAFNAPKRASYLQVVDPTKIPQLMSLDLINLLIEMPGSDLHLNFLPTGEMVPRIRKDGTMMPIMVTGGQPITLDQTRGNSLIAIFQRLGGLDLANKHKNQDGEIRLGEPGFFEEHKDVFGEADETMIETLTEYSLRVAYAKTITGGKLTLRLLHTLATEQEDLSTSGLSPHILEPLRQKIEEPQGLIVVSGPTGSGKTTTLSKSLVEINNGERHICTVEDPVEKPLPYAMQLQIGSFKNKNNEPGTFADGLRNILRHDPDVILVGETRDHETAEMSIHSALTGHIVFTTLHANDAIEALTTRLAGFRHGDTAIDPAALFSAVQFSYAQRLVRKLCDDCVGVQDAEQQFRNVSELTDVEIPTDGLLLPIGMGVIADSDCPSCFGKGYNNRLPVGEYLDINAVIRDELSKRTSPDEFRAFAIENGDFKPFAWDGFRLILSGKSDVSEVARKIGLQSLAKEAPTLVKMIELLKNEERTTKAVGEVFPKHAGTAIEALPEEARSDVISDMLGKFISRWNGSEEVVPSSLTTT